MKSFRMDFTVHLSLVQCQRYTQTSEHFTYMWNHQQCTVLISWSIPGGKSGDQTQEGGKEEARTPKVPCVGCAQWVPHKGILQDVCRPSWVPRVWRAHTPARARHLPSALFCQLWDQRIALCSSWVLRNLSQGSPPPTAQPVADGQPPGVLRSACQMQLAT